MGGLKDKILVTELLKTEDLSLNQAIKMARCHEQSKEDVEILEGSSNIQAVNRTPNDLKKQNNCRKCGHVHRQKYCPAKNQECRNCKKMGHFAKMCTFDSYQEQGDQSNSLQMNELNRNSEDPRAPKIKVSCSGNKNVITEMLPDTGADMCAADKNFLRNIGVKTSDLLPTQALPKAINGQRVPVLGKTVVEFQLKDRTSKEELFIFEHINCPVLSWMACKRLGIIPQNFPEPIQNSGMKRANNTMKEEINIVMDKSRGVSSAKNAVTRN